DTDGAAGVGRALVLAADGDDAQAAQVEQGLADLRDLPVQDGGDLRTIEQHVAVVVVAMYQGRRSLDRELRRQQTGELARPLRELFWRALHEHRPAHHLDLEGDRVLAAD